MIALDIFATAVSNANAKAYVKNKIDGVDLIPFLSGQNTTLPHDLLYWQNPVKDIDVVRGEKFKYLRIRNEEYVFDLKNDVSEQNNVLELHRDIYNDLKICFKEWEKGMIPPIFLGLSMGKEYDTLNPNRWGNKN